MATVKLRAIRFINEKRLEEKKNSLQFETNFTCYNLNGRFSYLRDFRRRTSTIRSCEKKKKKKR